MLAALPGMADTRLEGVAQALSIAVRGGLDAQLVDHLAKGVQPMALLRVLADRCVDPSGAIDESLRSTDPQLQRVAVSALRHADRARYLAWTEHAATSAEPTLAAAALPAALALGSQTIWPVVVRQADRDTMLYSALLGDDAQTQSLCALLDDEARRADALWALGFSGRVEAVDACVRWLGDPDVGRLAGEAFAGITGVDREDSELWISDEREPAPDEAGGDEPLPDLDEDLDTDLLGDPADDLPRPNPETLAAWWHGRRAAFATGRRYVEGQPVSGGGLLHGLRVAPSRRRHALALELLVRTRGRVVVPTRMLTAAQYPRLTAAANVPIEGDRPYPRL